MNGTCRVSAADASRREGGNFRPHFRDRGRVSVRGNGLHGNRDGAHGEHRHDLRTGGLPLRANPPQRKAASGRVRGVRGGRSARPVRQPLPRGRDGDARPRQGNEDGGGTVSPVPDAVRRGSSRLDHGSVRRRLRGRSHHPRDLLVARPDPHLRPHRQAGKGEELSGTNGPGKERSGSR